jgi:hypothetical protein
MQFTILKDWDMSITPNSYNMIDKIQHPFLSKIKQTLKGNFLSLVKGIYKSLKLTS